MEFAFKTLECKIHDRHQVAQIAYIRAGIVEIALLYSAILKFQILCRLQKCRICLSRKDRHIALEYFPLDPAAECISSPVVSTVDHVGDLLDLLKGSRPHLRLDNSFIRHTVDDIAGLADHIVEAYMVFLAESLSHQSHHLDRAGRDAEGVDTVPRIDRPVCGLASDSDSFCTVTVARRISQVKILLDRNHMHMGRQCNIRIIKNSCADHLALAAAEFDPFLAKTCSLVCVNIFLSGNRKERKTAAEFLLDLRICQRDRTADHCCHLCVMSAGMCHAGNRICHWM